jgi:hypothetical protein
MNTEEGMEFTAERWGRLHTTARSLHTSVRASDYMTEVLRRTNPC